MRGQSRHDQRQGCPIRDAARAQIVQAESERVEEQPGHRLRIIGDLGGGWGEGVGINNSGNYILDKQTFLAINPHFPIRINFYKFKHHSKNKNNQASNKTTN